MSQIIKNIETLLNDGEASFEQVNQMKKDIKTKEVQVNKLMLDDQAQAQVDDNANEFSLVDSYVQIGSQKAFVKAKVTCGTEDLYALESDRPFATYDGLCPRCDGAHIPLHRNRGFYILCSDLDLRTNNIMKRKPQF